MICTTARTTLIHRPSCVTGYRGCSKHAQFSILCSCRTGGSEGKQRVEKLLTIGRPRQCLEATTYIDPRAMQAAGVDAKFYDCDTLPNLGMGTALHWCAILGQVAIARLLCSHPAHDCTLHVTGSNITALDIARANGHSPLIAYLSHHMATCPIALAAAPSEDGA
mgnify:CR=1 FL=1